MRQIAEQAALLRRRRAVLDDAARFAGHHHLHQQRRSRPRHGPRRRRGDAAREDEAGAERPPSRLAGALARSRPGARTGQIRVSHPGAVGLRAPPPLYEPVRALYVQRLRAIVDGPSANRSRADVRAVADNTRNDAENFQSSYDNLKLYLMMTAPRSPRPRVGERQARRKMGQGASFRRKRGLRATEGARPLLRRGARRRSHLGVAVRRVNRRSRSLASGARASRRASIRLAPQQRRRRSPHPARQDHLRSFGAVSRPRAPGTCRCPELIRPPAGRSSSRLSSPATTRTSSSSHGSSERRW